MTFVARHRTEADAVPAAVAPNPALKDMFVALARTRDSGKIRLGGGCRLPLRTADAADKNATMKPQE